MASVSGFVVRRVMAATAFEFVSKWSSGELTRLELSTCSNLNLSLQPMRGRQMNWSVATMMATMVMMPQAMAGPFFWSAAVCR
jgi:hypothetical protein